MSEKHIACSILVTSQADIIMLKLYLTDDGHLTGASLVIREGVLVELAPQIQGRRLFITVMQKSIPLHLCYVRKETPIHHGNCFKQYYLYLGESLVGSILDVADTYCKFNNYSVTYVLPGDLRDFSCPTECQSGGLLIYQDGHGSFAALPAKEVESSLLVTDRSD